MIAGRSDVKIDASSYCLGFFEMVAKKENTLSKWAEYTGKCNGHYVTGQGIQEKLQFRHEEFAKKLLSKVLSSQINDVVADRMPAGLFGGFRSVQLEDSTCFQLPEELVPFFPGSRNGHGDSATARIQFRHELLSGKCLACEVHSFRDNDQKYAMRIADNLQKGDLVIRDMGYFVLKSFEAIMARGACFISRLRYGTNLYLPGHEEKIELLKTLRKHSRSGKNTLEVDVEMGSKERLPVRLVAVKLPAHVEEKRKRKAAKERNQKANHSPEYLEMLGWNIIVTNVESKQMTAEQLMKAYACRWYIEMIFIPKCRDWKSRLGVTALFTGKKSLTPARAVISFHLLLVWLTLYYARWFHHFLVAVYRKTERCLSLQKFAGFVKEYFQQLLKPQPTQIKQLIEIAANYYCYKKLKTHRNMIEKIYLFN